jgi:hypothetical protein
MPSVYQFSYLMLFSSDGCCDMVASNRFSALVAVAAKKAVT